MRFQSFGHEFWTSMRSSGRRLLMAAPTNTSAAVLDDSRASEVSLRRGRARGGPQRARGGGGKKPLLGRPGGGPGAGSRFLRVSRGKTFLGTRGGAGGSEFLGLWA